MSDLFFELPGVEELDSVAVTTPPSFLANRQVFEIQLDEPGIALIDYSSINEFILLDIYDDSGSIAGIVASITDNAPSLVKYLGAGTYYIAARVNAFPPVVLPSPGIFLAPSLVDETSGNDDSFDSASPLIIESEVYDSLGSSLNDNGEAGEASDSTDFYKIKIESFSTFSATIRDQFRFPEDGSVEDGSTVLYLYDETEKLLASSDSFSISNQGGSEQISRDLSPGVYFLEVEREAESSADYVLSSRVQELEQLAPSVDPNASFELAEFFRRGSVIYDTVGESFAYGKDNVDVFYFTGGSSLYDISLAGLQSNVDIYLYDDSGNLIEASTNLGNSPEQISRVLAGGKHFLSVVSESETPSSYELRIDDVSRARDLDASKDTATELIPGLMLEDNIGNDEIYGIDTIDYYKFQIEERTRAEISLSQLESPAQLELFNSSGNRLNISEISGIEPRLFSQVLNAGTYFVSVEQVAGNDTPYSILLEFEDIDGTFENAQFLFPEALNSDSIGGADFRDYYKFNYSSLLAESFGYSIIFQDLPNASTVKLFDDNQNEIDSFSVAADGSSIITRDGVVVSVNENSSSKGQLINLNPEGGQYFIEIISDNQSTDDYSFRFLSSFQDNDNTFEKSNPWLIGNAVSNQLGSAPFGGYDRTDVYNFEVQEDSFIGINILSYSSEVEFFLSDSEGALGYQDGFVSQATSFDPNSGLYGSVIFANVDAGKKYFVNVEDFSPSQEQTVLPYTLYTSAQVDIDGTYTFGYVEADVPSFLTDNDPIFDGSTSSISINEQIGYPLEYTGSFSSQRDYSDAYPIRLNGRKNLEFTLDDFEGDLQLILFKVPTNLVGQTQYDVEDLEFVKASTSKDPFGDGSIPSEEDKRNLKIKGSFSGEYWLIVQTPASNQGTSYRLTARNTSENVDNPEITGLPDLEPYVKTFNKYSAVVGVRNSGDEAVTSPFWIEAKAIVNGVAQTNDWEYLVEQPLAPGEFIDIPTDTLVESSFPDNSSVPAPPGIASLVVTVDKRLNISEIEESNEGNNVIISESPLDPNSEDPFGGLNPFEESDDPFNDPNPFARAVFADSQSRDFGTLGTSQNDVLSGGEDDDLLSGLIGNDNLIGGAGNDTLLGGEGNDNLIGGPGLDLIDGGEGIDRVNFRSEQTAVTVDLTQNTATYEDPAGNLVVETLLNVERVTGTDFDDVLIGDVENNVLSGGIGNDTLQGGEGNDNLIGGAGMDLFVIGANQGRDTVSDFELGIDQFSLIEGLSFGQLSLTQKNEHTQLSLGGEILAVIRNVSALELDASSFTANSVIS